VGIAERKEREKQELREKILAAATELFLEHGFHGTSTRMIADRIEYSPATIYLHFKDKNELFFAISERAFRLFFDYFSSVSPIADPMERLKALGHAYMRFALEHPAYYDLMFVMRAPMEAEKQEHTWSGEMSHRILTDTISECQEQGYFKGHDLHGLSLFIWSSVHGMATLLLRKRLSMYPDETIDSLMDNALNSMNSIIERT